MGNHLTIISYPQVSNSFFDEVAFRVNPGSRNGRAVFARYQVDTKKSLRMILKASASFGDDHRPDIDYLDLVGHGLSPGGFRLGDHDLIQEGRLSREVAEVLHALLPQNAKVRLLGCLTGGPGWARLGMLKAVSDVLGGREVLGTTVVIRANAFDEGGLKEDFRDFVSSRDTAPPGGS
jgi:hypothetical protein